MTGYAGKNLPIGGVGVTVAAAIPLIGMATRENRKELCIVLAELTCFA